MNVQQEIMIVHTDVKTQTGVTNVFAPMDTERSWMAVV